MSSHPRATVLYAEGFVGQILKGKWRVDELLGVGGMAAVYRVTHRNASRAALKLLHPSLAADAAFVERFLREGYLANSVEHPGVVRVLDDDVLDDGRPFLVQELLIGESLESLRRRVGRISPTSVASVGLQLLDIVAAAWSKGIVHRDIKPDNVFVLEDGIVKLLDFGVARLHTATSATIVGNAIGTPAYMPAEQAMGRWDALDVRADLYAIGATMFTLLTGRPPRDADTPNIELLQAMTKPVVRVLEIAPDAHPVLAAVIDKALAFDREERWPTPEAFAEALLATGLTGKLSLKPRPTVSVGVPTGTSSIRDMSGSLAQGASASFTAPPTTVTPASPMTPASLVTPASPVTPGMPEMSGTPGMPEMSGMPAASSSIALAHLPRHAREEGASPALSASPSVPATFVDASKTQAGADVARGVPKTSPLPIVAAAAAAVVLLVGGAIWTLRGRGPDRAATPAANVAAPKPQSADAKKPTKAVGVASAPMPSTAPASAAVAPSASTTTAAKASASTTAAKPSASASSAHASAASASSLPAAKATSPKPTKKSNDDPFQDSR